MVMMIKNIGAMIMVLLSGITGCLGHGNFNIDLNEIKPSVAEESSNSQETKEQPTGNSQATPTEYPLQGDFDIYLNNIYVPCYIRETEAQIQAVTDLPNAAGAWYFNGKYYIYDHAHQAFSSLKNTKEGDIIKIFGDGRTEYTCYKVYRNINIYSFDYTVYAEVTDAKIILQTCDPHYPQVMFAYFK